MSNHHPSCRRVRWDQKYPSLHQSGYLTSGDGWEETASVVNAPAQCLHVRAITEYPVSRLMAEAEMYGTELTSFGAVSWFCQSANWSGLTERRKKKCLIPSDGNTYCRVHELTRSNSLEGEILAKKFSWCANQSIHQDIDGVRTTNSDSSYELVPISSMLDTS